MLNFAAEVLVSGYLFIYLLTFLSCFPSIMATSQEVSRPIQALILGFNLVAASGSFRPPDGAKATTSPVRRPRAPVALPKPAFHSSLEQTGKQITGR